MKNFKYFSNLSRFDQTSIEKHHLRFMKKEPNTENEPKNIRKVS